jgi:hypothetical protein
MYHESIDVKEFIAKEQPGFRVRVRTHEVLAPKGLYSLDFIQESLNEQGEVQSDQTYNFFMTKDEVQTLCQGLMTHVV